MSNKTPMLAVSERLDSLISRLEVAEKVTKSCLTEFGSTALQYIVIDGAEDISHVNKVLGVLTPKNKQAVIVFFSHFLPYSYDKKTDRFGTRTNKTKVVEAKRKDVETFLADDDMDFWKWIEANTTAVEKKPEFDKRVENAVKAALNGGSGKNADEALSLSPYEVLKHVVHAGVSVNDLVKFSEALTTKAAEMKAEREAQDAKNADDAEAARVAKAAIIQEAATATLTEVAESGEVPTIEPHVIAATNKAGEVEVLPN